MSNDNPTLSKHLDEVHTRLKILQESFSIPVGVGTRETLLENVEVALKELHLFRHPRATPAGKSSPSRAQRWATACQVAVDSLNAAEAALSDLTELQSEYRDWLDNMPENLQRGPTGEKLEAVCGLDLEGTAASVSEAAGVAGEAEAMDLPLGYGKD